MTPASRTALRGLACVTLLAALGVAAPRIAAAPPRPVLLAVLGSSADANRLVAAQRGAEIAARGAPATGPLAGGVLVESFDDGGTSAGFKQALGRLRARKPLAVLALPSADLEPEYWKAAASLRVPWITLSGLAPDKLRSPDYLLHLGPTPVAQGIAAADAMVAPLAARRVGVVHEPSALGRALAGAFTRNLSERVTLAGIQPWDVGAEEASLRMLRGFETEWLYVALNGAPLHAFVQAIAGMPDRPRLFFADGARDASLLSGGTGALEDCVFLGGPDPEMRGRLGEALLEAIDRAGAPMEAVTPRAYEGARRILLAVSAAESTKLKALWTTLAPQEENAGALGPLRFEPFGGVRRFPHTLWRVRKGRYEEWPAGELPTLGCGPPIGFGRPPMATLGENGKIGVLTWGGEDKRTIEQDLYEIGLSTKGQDPELDAIVRAEIHARAIRIANRLFRREADGSPVPGWSWGMAFTTKPPRDDVKKSRQWLAVCAGDHEAAGGQAFGTWVAVYTTFLKRTMYASRKLDPPLSVKDKPLLDGTYRWGTDRGANFRADKIRCLMDGFASAMGLTLSHEFGHLCGCGHDTEHPTSIMNVVAGAGASWADAVWIPAHQRAVTSTLGLEPVPKEH